MEEGLGDPPYLQDTVAVFKLRPFTLVAREHDAACEGACLRVGHQTQKLLFVSESVGLVEYTEVLMPCIFNMYMVVMYYLSNRRYYDFLRDVSTEQLRHQIASVFLYASFEFASLVVMAMILQQKLRLSLLHQIAFVLETRQISIQAKVVMWAVIVLQTQVEHNGVDYSFQFSWLKTKKNS